MSACQRERAFARRGRLKWAIILLPPATLASLEQHHHHPVRPMLRRRMLRCSPKLDSAGLLALYSSPPSTSSTCVAKRAHASMNSLTPITRGTTGGTTRAKINQQQRQADNQQRTQSQVPQGHKSKQAEGLHTTDQTCTHTRRQGAASEDNTNPNTHLDGLAAARAHDLHHSLVDHRLDERAERGLVQILIRSTSRAERKIGLSERAGSMRSVSSNQWGRPGARGKHPTQTTVSSRQPHRGAASTARYPKDEDAAQSGSKQTGSPKGHSRCPRSAR